MSYAVFSRLFRTCLTLLICIGRVDELVSAVGFCAKLKSVGFFAKLKSVGLLLTTGAFGVVLGFASVGRLVSRLAILFK